MSRYTVRTELYRYACGGGKQSQTYPELGENCNRQSTVFSKTSSHLLVEFTVGGWCEMIALFMSLGPWWEKPSSWSLLHSPPCVHNLTGSGGENCILLHFFSCVDWLGGSSVNLKALQDPRSLAYLCFLLVCWFFWDLGVKERVLRWTVNLCFALEGKAQAVYSMI